MTTKMVVTTISSTQTAPIVPPSALAFIPPVTGPPVISDSQSPASNDSSCVGHEESTSSLVESTLIEVVPLCAHVDTNVTRPSAVYGSSPKAV